MVQPVMTDYPSTVREAYMTPTLMPSPTAIFSFRVILRWDKTLQGKIARTMSAIPEYTKGK
jgi:hypothetical protein